MLRDDLFTKAEVLMTNLLETVESFNNVKSVLDIHATELEAIHKKISSIERMVAKRVIKDAS